MPFAADRPFVMPYAARVRRVAWICALCGATAWVSGCGLTGSEARATARVAIVSVVAADGVEALPSRAALATQLEGAFLATGAPPPVPNAAVGRALGGERLGLVADEFAARGALASSALQLLMATPMETRRGLLVRVERNDVARLEPATEPVLDRDGQALADRHQVILAQQRGMRVSATLLDLNTGRTLWRRAWSAAPVATVRYVNYSGSSFTGSVAATLANTVVNGLRAPAAPAPPSVQDTLDALFREVVENLP